MYYLPVERQILRYIRIEIRDLADKRVTFNARKSPTNVVLYFRRVLIGVRFMCIGTSHQILQRPFPIMDPLARYHIYQTGRGRGDNAIGPIYSNPPFLPRGHGNCWIVAFVRASLALDGRKRQ